MQQVTVEEAKAQLDQLVAKAAHGEAIAITQDGKAVAQLVAAEDAQRPDETPGHEERQTALARFLALRAARAPMRLTQEEVRSWIDEGRR